MLRIDQKGALSDGASGTLSMEVGQLFAIREGGKTVGAGVILRIVR
jgi:translation elongation factor EF-Tu-like GTPase